MVSFARNVDFLLEEGERWSELDMACGWESEDLYCVSVGYNVEDPCIQSNSVPGMNELCQAYVCSYCNVVDGKEMYMLSSGWGTSKLLLRFSCLPFWRRLFA